MKKNNNNNLYGVRGATILDIPALDYITEGYSLEAVAKAVNATLCEMDTTEITSSEALKGFEVVYDLEKKEFLPVSEILWK